MSSPAVKRYHPNSLAREEVLKFLYKCEIDKVYYFSTPYFESHARLFEFTENLKSRVSVLAQGVLGHLHELDEGISEACTNWSVKRMGVVDRAILRQGSFELNYLGTPAGIVLDEAIELAKKYGSEHSSSFVNGILDKIAKGKKSVTTN